MLVKCEYCHGKGEVPCPECNAGAGEAGVSRSPGEGCGARETEVEERGSTADNERRACRCSGYRTGWVRCEGCMGSGYVDMPCFA